jgi:hypothetical protein
MAHNRLIDLGYRHGTESEVTLYVKGFLARGEKPDHFDAWLHCHRHLSQTCGWGEHVLGYSWDSGRFQLRPPLPFLGAVKTVLGVARVVRGVGRLNPAGALGWVAAEQLVRMSARFLTQYRAATRSARERAEELAGHLRELSSRHARVRVVAHSLGCLQAIEAVSRLREEQRPEELHLCAAACRESDVAESLPRLARGRARLYFTPRDLVLEAAFRAMSRGRALGAVGPSVAYPGLTAVDVSDQFGFWVHHEYKNRFARIVMRSDSELGRVSERTKSLPPVLRLPGG